MDARQRLASCCALAAIAALGLATPAAAAPKAIKGKLSKRGFTVLALDLSGRGRSVAATPKFRLRPTAKVVTLHLRDRNGQYAGPIVAGRTGKRVVVGVRAGADLGRVRVKNGYAFFLPEKEDEVLVTLKARARQGKPIGAGILGRVRSSVSGRGGLGRDLDRDGLPGAFDVDDDGDLIYDNVDRSLAGARTSATAEEELNARWVMNGGLQVSYLADRMGFTQGVSGYTLNQNAAGPFAANAEFEKLRDLLMEQRGAIYMPLPGEPTELDCGYRPASEGNPEQPGLSYCTSGGTGGAITRMQKFPDQFDSDLDGLGSMTAVPRFAEGQDGLGLIQTVDPKTVFGIAPNAKEADIEAGDTYLERPVSNPETFRTVTLRSVYGTLPALASWADTTRSVTINYPVPEGSEGSESNGFTVEPSPQGDYVIRLTIWRPQRDAVDGSGEGTGWIDLGGLTYTVVGKTAEQNRKLFKCPGSSYSTNDGNLSVTPAGLLDKAVDQPVNRANTLTFTVNLSGCLQGSGINWQPPGPTIDLFVAASSAYGDVVEGLGFSFKPIAAGGTSSADFSGTWKFVGSVPSNEIEWTITAANGASTSRTGAIFYNGRTVTGGTPPAGWTCQVSNAGGTNDAYVCDGGPLTSGQSITGRTTLDAPYSTSSPVDMLICDASNQCSGGGMVYKP